MTMESGIVREGNSQKLRNTGWGGRIRRTRIRGRRAAVDAGVLALIAVLLWAPCAEAHPGQGASGLTAALLHWFVEPVHGLFVVSAAAVLCGLTALAVARPLMRRPNP